MAVIRPAEVIVPVEVVIILAGDVIPPVAVSNPAEVIVPVAVVDILPDVVILPEALMASVVVVPVNVGLAVDAYPDNPVTIAPVNVNVLPDKIVKLPLILVFPPTIKLAFMDASRVKNRLPLIVAF